MHFSRSHDAVIRVYDMAGNVIETHENKGAFKEAANVEPFITIPRMIRRRTTTAKGTWLLAMLLLTAFIWTAESGNNERHKALSRKRDVGGQIFDVTVGPVGNELTFMPDTVTIGVGDTVRWTWASNHHTVTSGTDCTADGQFCSPGNMNCDAGITNNTGFVYEFTFTQPGMYQYFCHPHCFVGMTGVVIVLPAVRPTPVPRPRPTPARRL